eukprot:325443_1
MLIAVYCFILAILVQSDQILDISWQEINTTLPYQLFGPAFAITNTTLYVFGGKFEHATFEKIFNTTFIMELSSFKFINCTNCVTPVPFWCANQCSVTINNSLVYIFYPKLQQHHYSNETKMFIFNTINNAWINNSAITNSLPYKNIEYGSCVTSNSSHIFIFGGAFAYNHFTNIIQIYNFNDNIWHSYSSHNSLNKLVDSACIYSDISIFNASIFIFGGTLSSGHKSDKIFQYIIDNNQWIQ